MLEETLPEGLTFDDVLLCPPIRTSCRATPTCRRA